MIKFCKMCQKMLLQSVKPTDGNWEDLRNHSNLYKMTQMLPKTT